MPPKKLNQPKCAGHRERTPTKQGVSSLTPLIKLPKEPIKITAIKSLSEIKVKTPFDDLYSDI